MLERAQRDGYNIARVKWITDTPEDEDTGGDQAAATQRMLTSTTVLALLVHRMLTSTTVLVAVQKYKY